MAATTVGADVLEEAVSELKEAVRLLENGSSNPVCVSQAKEKVQFSIYCITARIDTHNLRKNDRTNRFNSSQLNG